MGSLLSNAVIVDVVDYSHGLKQGPDARAISGSELLQERESSFPSEFQIHKEIQPAKRGLAFYNSRLRSPRMIYTSIFFLQMWF